MSAQLPEHEYLLLKYLVRFYADEANTGRPRTTRQITAALGGEYPGGDRAIIDTLAGYGVHFKHPARPGPASITGIGKLVTETVENDPRTSGEPSTWEVPAGWDA